MEYLGNSGCVIDLGLNLAQVGHLRYMQYTSKNLSNEALPSSSRSDSKGLREGGVRTTVRDKLCLTNNPARAGRFHSCYRIVNFGTSRSIYKLHTNTYLAT